MIDVKDGDPEYLTLAEVHEELLKLLLRFDSFCKKYSLRYSLDSGTLLGAVRHKGFIPWDDDLDVDMPRPDYERLLSLEKELPRGLHLMHAANSKFAYGFCKICTDDIRAQEPSYEGVMNETLWIDILPIDGVPSNSLEQQKSRKRIWNDVRRNVWATVNHSCEKGPKRIVKSFCGALFRLGNPRARMLRTINEAISNPGYDAAVRLGCPVGTEKFSWSIPKDGYERTVEMEFEGHMFPCMGCWDEFLTALYGDYMQLPPEDQRQSHCLKAWRVNKE